MILKMKDGGLVGVKCFTAELVEKSAGKSIVAIVSTEDKDADGDIIRAEPNARGKGWVLDVFNKQPRVLWVHDRTLPNLASAKAWVADKQLLLQPTFDPQDALAMKIDQKYRDGYLSEWSVSFKAKRANAEPLEGHGFEFFETLLKEVSAVNIGANPSTETISKAFGISMVDPDEIDDKEMSALSDKIDDLTSAVDEFRARVAEIENAILRGDKSLESGTSTDQILDAIGDTMRGVNRTATEIETMQR